MTAVLSSEAAWIVGLEPPPALVKSLADARRSVEFIGHCREVAPDLGIGADYHRVSTRYGAALQRAEEIWGRTVSETRFEDVATAPPSCGRRDVREAAGKATLALDIEERAFDKATAAMQRGAWIGPLKLCRETVRGATSGSNHFTGQPSVELRLRPGATRHFASITGRSIDSRLAIRLRGAIISQPYVNERIDKGRVQISGPPAAVLDPLRAALKKAC